MSRSHQMKGSLVRLFNMSLNGASCFKGVEDEGTLNFNDLYNGGEKKF